jgi:hypothetical protein
MRALPTLLLLLSAAVLFQMTIAEAHPQWLRFVGLDWGGLADAKERLALLRKRRAELMEECARIHGRPEKRLQIFQELLTGRIDFFTAAARFQELTRLSPSAEKVLAALYPGMSADERACRHLLDWIKQHTIDTPDRTACQSLHARLKAELEHYLRTHGDVRLPGKTEN